MSETEACPACGKEVEATVTMMQAHWTLECDKADSYSGNGEKEDGSV